MQKVLASLPVGAVIQGRYTVESLFGEGSFGSIYLVGDQDNKQKLFVLAEVFNPNEEESYRFTLEYVAPASLDHQALPRVQYVVNDDRLGRGYVLMSSIEEPTLETLRLQQPEKRFPLPKVMAFMVPVINALNYLHHRNPPIIHQNINPTNIIVSRALNAPVLIMLDLIKECDSTTTTLHYFAPGYGAPEQYGEEISTGTDIYALGATIYTLLTGTVPPDALYRKEQIASRGIDPLQPVNQLVASIPALIADSVHRAMSLDSDERFPTVEQFRQALEADPTWWPLPGLNQRPMKRELDLASEPAAAPLPQPGASLTEQCTESAPSVQRSLEPVIEPTGTPQAGSTSIEEESPEPGDVQPVSPQSPYEILRFAQDDSVAKDDSIARDDSVAKDDGMPTDVQPVPPQSAVGSRKSGARPALKQARSVPFRKLAVLLPILLLLLVGGSALAVRLSQTAYLSSRSATPTSILLHQTTPYASPNTTVVLTLTPSSISGALQPPAALPTYPKVAKQYSGTLADIPTRLTTGMTLRDIQEQQGNISGYFAVTLVTASFNILPANGPFKGTITPAGQIHLTVMSNTGQAAFSFEGSMQPNSTMVGTYCSLDAVTGTCSDYGLWSVSPAAS